MNIRGAEGKKNNVGRSGLRGLNLYPTPSEDWGLLEIKVFWWEYVSTMSLAELKDTVLFRPG